MTYMLMGADYTLRNGKPVILLRARDDNGTRHIFEKEDFIPYFYAPADEVAEKKDLAMSVDGVQVSKVYTDIPSEVRTRRENYSTSYEADVLFPWRFLIDRGIKSGFDIIDGGLVPTEVDNGQKFTKLYVDIEVEVTGNAIDPIAAKDMILTIGYSLDGEEPIILTAKDEGEEIQMLYEFIEIVNRLDPDLITGWNVFYDLATIIGRCRRLNVDANKLSPSGYVDVRFPNIRIMGRNVVDMYQAFRQYYQNKVFPSFKLDDIAAREEYNLGWTNDERFDYENDMNRHNMDIIVPYNRDDVQKLIDIDRHLELLDHFDGIRKVAGCSIEDSFTVSRYAGIMLLREYHGNLIVPTGGRYGREKEEYVGAHVVEPQKGIFENVIALDFARMYPSIIISFNMSPETWVPESEVHKYGKDELYEVDGIYFKKSPIGIVPLMLEKMQTARNVEKQKMKQYDTSDSRYKIHDLKQYSYKQMTAAVYGYFAFPGSRLYFPQISKTTTFIGRRLVHETIDFINNMGMHALYGDTDSILARNIEGDPIEKGKELEVAVNAHFKKIAEDENWKIPAEMEFEQLYGRLLFSGVKKRYAGWCVYYKGKPADEIVIKGFEAKRSDSSPTSQKLQTRVLDLILHDKPEKEIRSTIIDMIYNMKGNNDVAEVGIPKPMKKNPNEYGNPGALLGVMYANEYMGKNFGVGEGKISRAYRFYVKRTPDGLPVKISYMFKGKMKTKKVNRIALYEEDSLKPYENIIDWNMQVSKVIDAKVEPILQAYGLSMSEVRGGTKQMRWGDYQ